MRRARVRCATAVVVLAASLPVAGAAQQASDTIPTVFRSLQGAWVGTGQLMGRSAEFRMSWFAGLGGFVRLSFANGFVDEDGSRTPVLESEAVYLANVTPVRGVWIDTRSRTLELEAAVTDSSLVTTWWDDTERGRTEYIVRSTFEVVVLDFVEGAEGWRPFGEAMYRRAEP